MFKGSESTNFKTDIPQEKVFETIQDQLEDLGSAIVSDNGVIRINTSRFGGFAHDVEIIGRVKSKDDRYNVELNWEAKPNWVLVILIALCFMGVGLILLVFPYMASKEIQKKCRVVLDNIRFDFK